MPANVSTAPLPADQESGLPLGVQDGIWDLYALHPDIDINSLEWDAQSGVLKVYTADSTAVAPLLSKHVRGADVEIVAAKHSKADIDKVLNRIVATGGQLSNGQRVVTAQPAQDGSTIVLGVESSLSGKGLAAPDVARQFESDIPLRVEAAAPVEPALRNIGYYVNFFSGAYMQSAASACTTGYRITNTSTNTPAMLSAEHCGRGNIGASWSYSSVATPESSLGTYQGMLTVAGPAGAQVDTGIWLGGDMSKFYPAVFNGTNDGNSILTAIRGAVVPVVGASVCYSGSFSGNICGNVVQTTGAVVCYSVTQCYANQTQTVQSSGIPAVGNGDSGGPVYQSISGLPYGAGIISGMQNANSNCSGEPGGNGRSCSTTVWFAPLNNALGSNNWGFNYVP